MPLFLAWRGVRPRAAAGYACVAGAAYYGFLLSWAWYFGAIAIVPFVAVMAAYWAMAGALIAWLSTHRIRGPVVTPMVDGGGLGLGGGARRALAARRVLVG